MTSKYDLITNGLLAELVKEEEATIKVGSQLEQVQVKFQVASQKYAAVRNIVTKRLGYSPYSENFIGWPVESIQTIANISESLGKYRFIHMRMGDTIVEALKEVNDPMTLDEIVERLENGGRRMVEPRMVNAALMKTTGIEKTEDGKYLYKEPELEDIPLE